MLFRAISAFTGDFDLDAAEGMGAGESLAGHDIAELLFGLVDKSMVRLDQHGTGTPRYRLLESIRNFGLARLDDGGELEEYLDRHLAYFADHAEQLQRRQRSGDLAGALSHLDIDEGISAPHSGTGCTTAASNSPLESSVRSGTCGMPRGQYREGSEWCAELFRAGPGTWRTSSTPPCSTPTARCWGRGPSPTSGPRCSSRRSRSVADSTTRPDSRRR